MALPHEAASTSSCLRKYRPFLYTLQLSSFTAEQTEIGLLEMQAHANTPCVSSLQQLKSAAERAAAHAPSLHQVMSTWKQVMLSYFEYCLLWCTVCSLTDQYHTWWVDGVDPVWWKHLRPNYDQNNRDLYKMGTRPFEFFFLSPYSRPCVCGATSDKTCKFGTSSLGLQLMYPRYAH